MRLLFPLLLAAGCAPTGIFMITVPYSDGAVECTDEPLEENFEDGFSPDPEDGGDTSWVYEEEYVGADAVMFFHMAATSGGAAVLTWGDQVFPGVPETDGWTFSWTEATSASDRAEHEDGYFYETSRKSDSETVIHVAVPMFADLSGTISGSSSSTTTYVESDEWDPADTDFGMGQIPSETYLVYKDDGDLLPQTNGWEDDDCDGDECELKMVTKCSQAGSAFTAKHVDGDDTMFYNDWKDDSQ